MITRPRVYVYDGNLDTVETVETIGTVDLITSIGTVDLITEVANISSLDVVDSVLAVQNVASVDLVDAVTLVGTVSEVANVSSVDTVDTVTELTDITNPVTTLDPDMEVAQGNIAGHSIMTKFGANSDIDIASVPESIWGGGGLYTWLPDVGGEALEVVSTDINDTGIALSSGTATGGSIVTLIDTGADFVADGVAIGDYVINDSNDQFAVISAVAITTLTHAAINNGSQENFISTPNAAGDTYRVANANGTGLGVGVIHGIDATGLFASEVYIMNGTTAVPLKRNYMGTHRMAGVKGATIAGNLGIIKSQTQVGATLTAQMNIGTNKTLMAVLRTPSDKVAYFRKGYVAISKTGNPTATNTAQLTWRITPFGSVTSINGLVEVISTGDSSWQYEYKSIPGIPPLTLVEIRCDDVSHDGTGIVGGFDVEFVDIGA